MALIKFTDEFGQEWTDWATAVEVGPISKRIMVRDAVEVLRERVKRGDFKPGRPLSTFVTTGDTLFVVELNCLADGTRESVAVHACKVLAHTWDYKL